MLPPLPRCSSRASSSLISPGHISLPRKRRRVGLHIFLFEACSAFTHVAACPFARSPNRDPLSEGFSHFVTSMTAPVASGWSDLAGWDSHPLESAALSRRTLIAEFTARDRRDATKAVVLFRHLISTKMTPIAWISIAFLQVGSAASRPCLLSIHKQIGNREHRNR